jgi:hypothetical protein
MLLSFVLELPASNMYCFAKAVVAAQQPDALCSGPMQGRLNWLLCFYTSDSLAVNKKLNRFGWLSML